MFGLSVVDFGLAHLTGRGDVAPLVPKWMPLGGDFWTVLTGIAFVLAGPGFLREFSTFLRLGCLRSCSWSLAYWHWRLT